MIRLLAISFGNARPHGSTKRQPMTAIRMSALALSVSALVPGYSHAADDLVLDNLIVNAGTGGNPAASGAGSIAIGPGANANGESGGDYSAIAIGATSVADGRATVAVGENANVHGDRSSAFGVSSNVNANRALALGADTKVTAHGAVALGEGSVADRANTVSVGDAGSERQLVNLRAGTRDTDATNLSQLKPVVDALGGDAAVSADGTVRGPNYTIDGKSFNNIGNALTNLDGRVTTIDGRVSTVETDVKSIRTDVDDLGAQLDNGTTGLVRQDPASLAISIGADKGGTSVSVAGANGTRTLTGLSNGTGDTDAVTVAQLKAAGLINPNGKPLGAILYDDLTLGGVGGTLLDNVKGGVMRGQHAGRQRRATLCDGAEIPEQRRFTEFPRDECRAERHRRQPVDGRAWQPAGPARRRLRSDRIGFDGARPELERIRQWRRRAREQCDGIGQ